MFAFTRAHCKTYILPIHMWQMYILRAHGKTISLMHYLWTNYLYGKIEITDLKIARVVSVT
jgi:hypothetical protein